MVADIFLYNTLTRKKQRFTPLTPAQIRMYVCGMTVYDFCHLGHARVMVVFDAFVRYLRHRGYDVLYVRNITDVDDKIVARAAQRNISAASLTDEFINHMHDDERALGNIPPDVQPRVSENIDAIIALINTLIQRNHAYVASNNDVYFRVRSFTEYGQLSGRNIEQLLVGARVEASAHKEDPLDFALWKAADSGDARWQSPWGMGRPGWHIECSAMSMRTLGETFDIHGGGPDLIFPHHENEIAQSCCATGKPYARYWMHIGAIVVDGQKMSKSLGNFHTIADLRAQYHPLLLRYFLLSSHYRSPVDFQTANIQASSQALNRLLLSLRNHDIASSADEDVATNAFATDFYQALDDDFNTPAAFAVLFALARELNKATAATAARLAATLITISASIGLDLSNPETLLKSTLKSASPQHDSLNDQQIAGYIQQRQDARLNKKFAEADRIREVLLAANIVIEDTPQGSSWRRK